MKNFIVLLASLLSFSAFADLSIECTRDHRPGVTLNSGNASFTLEDGWNEMVGKLAGLSPAYQTQDALVFAVDFGTSVKQIYAFTGIGECSARGRTETAKLFVSTQSNGEKALLEETLSCSCASN